MKVGVFLGGQMPTGGGGFTFRNDILQALARVESKHTFVILDSFTVNQSSVPTSERLTYVSSRRGFLRWARAKLTNTPVKIVLKLPIVQNWLATRYKNWLRRTLSDLGIEFMWFITPAYVEVDIPYIFTVWDLQHRLQPWFPEVIAEGQWHARENQYSTAIPRASAVIIGTESGKKEIVRFYGVPPEHVRLISHPTPRFALSAPEDSGKQVLAKYRIPRDYLFYPAQFWPHKNHVGLLLAVKILKEQYGLIMPVVFVGSDMGNLQYIRQMVARLGLSTQVHFLGFVPREDLVGLYCNAFALTYLTFFGPENLPPLEAFSLGCPVIASNVSGALEQLGDAALLVDPKDERQIADAIKRLHEDATLRDTLVSRGLARASKWTADDFVKSVLSLFDEFEPIRRCWGR